MQRTTDAIHPAEPPHNLVKYNAAKQALAEAVRIDEVKDIRDKAAAMRAYAMQAKNRELIDHATEIHLRAERRAGEILKDMARAGERAIRKNMKSQPATSKLADLDINKSQSSRWQKLADLSEEDFEDLTARAKQKACDAVDHARQPKPGSKLKPKPKPKRPGPGDRADITAACVSEVEMIVRAAMTKLDAEERTGLLDQLVHAIQILGRVRHANAGKANGHADALELDERWTEAETY
jgi:hypothetical protein